VTVDVLKVIMVVLDAAIVVLAVVINRQALAVRKLAEDLQEQQRRQRIDAAVTKWHDTIHQLLN